MTQILKISGKVVAIEKVPIEIYILLIIAILEFIIILYLIFKKNKKVSGLSDAEKKAFKVSKENEIDMDDLLNNIHKSKALYKELIRKCHPDKFINDPRQKIADEISQEITKNEKNYKNLNSLKDRAIRELNINF